MLVGGISTSNLQSKKIINQETMKGTRNQEASKIENVRLIINCNLSPRVKTKIHNIVIIKQRIDINVFIRK